jgi:hypothetical protein
VTAHGGEVDCSRAGAGACSQPSGHFTGCEA